MNEHMSENEIFEMLKPKFEKNGIKCDRHITFIKNDTFYADNDMYMNDELYSTEVMKKIVALAYRCGYGRGAKGRPFNYADKEVKEVPVSKELHVGTRVKMIHDYSNYEDYKRFYPPIGVCGTVECVGSVVLVKWDTDVKDGCWYCNIEDVEAVG